MSNHLPKETNGTTTGTAKRTTKWFINGRCGSVQICWLSVTSQVGPKLEFPPLFAQWIISVSVRAEDREEVLGTMDERFFHVSQRSGAGAAKRWYVAEAMIFLGYLCHRRVSRWVERWLKPLGLLFH